MNPALRHPDPEICRTRYFFSTYWECLVDYVDPIWDCPYLIEFKLRCYCMHNDRKEFAKRNKD